MRYMGIDLGDGESAVAILTEDSVIEPKVQYLGRQKSILSVVGTSASDILVGEAALLAPGVQNLRARFKSRYLSEAAAKADIRRFAMGIHDLLGEVDMSSLRVALGVPAGWTDQEREDYASLVRDAGFQNLYTVSESRAAFLYCRQSHSLKVDRELMNKPALVIDIGSSTTDFAYIVEGQEKKIGTFGNINLGGGVLDALILADAVDRSENGEQIQKIFDEEPTWRNFAELAARRLKEMYFVGEDMGNDELLSDTAMLYYMDPPVPLRFELERDTMERLIQTPIDVLNDRSFSETLDITLRDAVTATRAHPPELIIVTGGASRMAFFKQACQAAFPDAILTVAGEPEFTTAKGLAYAARIDERIAVFRNDIRGYFASDAIYRHVDDNLNALAHLIVPPLAKHVIDKAVVPAALAWREGAGGSLTDLEKRLSKQAETVLCDGEISQIISPFVNSWSRTLVTLVQKDIDGMLRKSHLDVSLESSAALRTDASIEGLTLVMPGDGLGAIVIALSGYIVASLFGGTGTALLVAAGLSNPLALVVGAAVGMLLGAMGASYGKNKAKDMPLPIFMRKMIPRAMLKKTLESDKQREKIEASLYNAMTDREGVFCTRLIGDIALDLTRQLDRFQKDEEIPLR